jgi:hypothetical protein
MRMCRQGARVVAMAFVVSLSNTIGFSGHAADFAPIVQGGGYFNWTGLYAGGNLGGGAGRTSFTVTAPGLFTNTSDEIRGFVGGGQAGFNWQFGPWVAGVEGDLQFTHQRNGVEVFGLLISNGMDYFGTLRGRFGYAIDGWLFYATAGGGFAGTHATYGLAGVGGFAESCHRPMGRRHRRRDPDLGSLDRQTRISLYGQRLGFEQLRRPGRHARGQQVLPRQRVPHRTQLSLLSSG